MKHFLIAFFILFAAMIAGVQINKDPGYVLITVNHWSVETTLWAMILGLIVLFLILQLLLRLCQNILHTPRNFALRRAKRRAQKAQAITRKGLIEYSEGYWNQAKNHLIEALPDTDTPLLNYLTAARAAQKMGDFQLRDHYLREAQQSVPDAKIAVELTQAQLQLANHQWEQALATLRHLHDIAPRHPYVLKLLMHLYQEVKDWPQLIALLPSLKKYKIITEQELENLQKNGYLQAITELSKQNQYSAAHTLFDSLPKSLTTDPDIIAVYVSILFQTNEYDSARNLLQRCLRKELYAQLIILYSSLPHDENQLAFLEGLLKKNTHTATLYLCLGQLCIKQQLWGKAKSYLEKSNEIKASPLTYMTLGKLQEKLNEHTLACASYKQGLNLHCAQLDYEVNL